MLIYHKHYYYGIECLLLINANILTCTRTSTLTIYLLAVNENTFL